MAFYKTGTVTLTNGSTTVTGSGTSWVDVGTLNAGDMLYAPDGKLYEINTIGSNTGLTLVSNYLGSTVSGAAYNIIPIGLLPSALALNVKTTLTNANTALTSMVRYDINSMGLTLTQQQNARTNIAALSAYDVGQGYLSLSVAGSTNVTLTATQAANQFLTFTGTLTGNITVYCPAAARLFFVNNATSGAYTLTFAATGGTGLAVTQGYKTMLECDGTNVVNPFTVELGNEAVAGNLTVTGSITGNLTGTATGLAGTPNISVGTVTANGNSSFTNSWFSAYGGASFGASTWGMSIGNGGSSANYYKANSHYWQDGSGTALGNWTGSGLAVTGALSATGGVSNIPTVATDTQSFSTSTSTTGANYIHLVNSNGAFNIGIDNAAGTALGLGGYAAGVVAPGAFVVRAGGVNAATFGSTGLVLSSGTDLTLGRAYSAGVVVATGTIAIKDSTGTTYNVLVHT